MTLECCCVVVLQNRDDSAEQLCSPAYRKHSVWCWAQTRVTGETWCVKCGDYWLWESEEPHCSYGRVVHMDISIEFLTLF